MTDYKVGRGNPPLHSRFTPGNEEWRKRKPKRDPSEQFSAGDDIKAVLGSSVQLKRNGKIKKEVRLKGIVEKMVAEALQGDVTAANDLLSFRLNAEEVGDMQDVIVYLNEPGDDTD